MVIELKHLLNSRFFLSIIFIKLILIIFLNPVIQSNLFLPFMISWFENPSLSPWDNNFINNVEISPFPYGIIMFIVFLPMLVLGYFIDFFLNSSFELYFSHLGFKLTLLIFDIGILILLIKIFENLKKQILFFYWLSPIIIFVVYWHGQLDLIPVFFLLFSFYYLKNKNFVFMSILLALAIVAKHSMILSVPFIIIYLLKQRFSLKKLSRIFLFFFITIIIFEFPFIFNDGYNHLVLQNKEVEKLYWLNIKMGEINLIYLTPLIYLLLLYFFQRIRRINFDLLFAGMSVAFSIIIFLTPSSPGWIIWIIPILIIHQIKNGVRAQILTLIFSLFFIIYNFFISTGSEIYFLQNFDLKIPQIYFNDYININYTIFVTLGLILSIQILREGIRLNDYYRFSTKPISIGITGDSGTGKTTLSNCLVDIFGKKFTQEILGDDYHNWARNSHMWKNQTHLDPKSNNLLKFTNDLRMIINGSAINSKKYNHSTGNFEYPTIKESSDFIIVNGLHTLFQEQIRELFNIKIYMEMNRDLRNYLKTFRDVNFRKKNQEDVEKSISAREPDYLNYIKPQKKYSNLSFYLDLNNNINFDNSKNYDLKKFDYKLKVYIKNCLYYQDLYKVLTGICGMDVNVSNVESSSDIELEISGEVSNEDIKISSNKLVPQIEELLDIEAKFSDGITGVMQLIVLIELSESLKRINS